MRFPLVNILGIAAVLGLAGVTSAVAAPHSSASVSASSAHLAALAVNPQGNIPAVLDSIGSKDYPGLYGGLVEVDNGRHIDVYLTRLKPSAEAAFTACRSCEPRRRGDLTFVKTAYSLRYLDALHQRVVTASHRLMRRGIRLTEWWPQIQDAREMIGVQDLTRAQTTLLKRTFGARSIRVFNVPPGQVPVSTSGRTNDSSPWTGGDTISDFAEGCTSSFAVTVNGNARLVTAAHCFPNGDSVYNYNVISGKGNQKLIGTVTARATSSGTVDAEIIAAKGTGYVWPVPQQPPRRSPSRAQQPIPSVPESTMTAPTREKPPRWTWSRTMNVSSLQDSGKYVTSSTLTRRHLS